MSKILNINELYNTSKRKELNKIKLYNELLQKCHNRIKLYAQHEKTKCIYRVPEYTIGYPLYNYNDLKEYIINSLQNNGFIIKDSLSGILISWDKNTNGGIDNRVTKGSEELYRPIEDYNPTGNILYNQNSLLSIQNKSNQFKNIT
ncbi:MAG: hypothetical protein CMG46_01975 [Candidatus Marinimicrobia bacterium]|nr:hypothetical protein [Candidatus Neomarinimicrobiota bacterium]|tara:strand:+ start:391 stop:828 length:438 start_codon:yes stop_codon:yes gene_type:complete